MPIFANYEVCLSCIYTTANDMQIFCIFQIKTFGMLIKGLRVAFDLLSALHREDHGIPALSKSVDIPTLSSLDELVHQFEEDIHNDFEQYQV